MGSGLRHFPGTRAMAILMVAVMVASSMPLFLIGTSGADESGSGTGPETRTPTVNVVYHSYYKDPAIGADDLYNNADGYRNNTPGSAKEITIPYYGETFSTEYNPQLWDDGWFTVKKYETHSTVVFRGWMYMGSNGKVDETVYDSEGIIFCENGIWYATDIENPSQKVQLTKKLPAGQIPTIHIYAKWTIAQHVVENDEEFDTRKYVVISNKHYYTITDSKGEKIDTSGVDWEFTTTDAPYLKTDSWGREFVIKIHERFGVREYTGPDPQYDRVVNFYDVDYPIAKGSSTAYIDGYPCTVVDLNNSDEYVAFVECFYYRVIKDPSGWYAMIQGLKYPVRAIAGDSKNVEVNAFGQWVSCPIDTTKVPGTAYVGFSRYYLMSGDAYTNFRLIDGTLDSSHLDDSLFDQCTIRGKTSGSCLDLGEEQYNIGSFGCVIDNISLNASAGSVLKSNGNLLVIGSGVTTIGGSPDIEGTAAVTKNTSIAIHSGTFGNVTAGSGTLTNTVLVRDAAVTGTLSGQGAGTTVLYVGGASSAGRIDNVSKVILYDLKGGSKISEIQRASSVIFDSSKVILGEDSETYALQDIQGLVLRCGSIVTLCSPIDDMPAYSSVDGSNTLIIGGSFDLLFGQVSGTTILGFKTGADAFASKIIGSSASEGVFKLADGTVLEHSVHGAEPGRMFWYIYHIIISRTT